jgi:DNA-binding NarL/FixJ family response regulator
MSPAACDPHTGGMETAATPRKVSIVEGSPMKTTPTRRTVFIVEDSPIVRRRLVALMGEIPGVSVVGQADTQEDAATGILREQPDWVLLDIQLIGGTGIEVLRRVRARVPGTRFIVLTHLDNPQYRRICMQAGADYFFDKTQTTVVKEIIAGPH